VVALAGTPETGAGIYVTRDAGHTWQRINETPLFADISALVTSSRDLRTLYLATRQHYDHRSGKSYRGGVFASRDGGITWRQVLDFRFVQAMAISPADPRMIYVGTTDHPYHDDYPAEGVLKSTDSGATWRHVNVGLSHRNVNFLSVSPHDPSVLYVGTSGNGVFVGKDAGVAHNP
jgi:photosystem II stability/assembly factor-like uncharacterized protein